MHRSGTSLVSNFLHQSGIDMGNEDLVGPGPGNVRGHFESAAFVDFHKEIMAREAFDQFRIDLPRVITDDDRRQAREIIRIRTDSAAGAPWGWKDPRTSLFLPFWENLLPNARYLLLVRKPTAVADSLIRRESITSASDRTWWRSATMNCERWRCYTSSCLEFAKPRREKARVFILEDILANPKDFAQQLSAWLTADFDHNVFTSLYSPGMLKERAPWRLVLPQEMFRCERTYRMAKKLQSEPLASAT
jgi:hypothetical protein